MVSLELFCKTASQKKETNVFAPRNVRCLEYRVKFKVPVFLQRGLLLPGADKVTRAVELDAANISLFRGPVPAALQALPWWGDGPSSSPRSELPALHSDRMGVAVIKPGHIWKEHDYRASFFPGTTLCEGLISSCGHHRLGEPLCSRTDLSKFTVDKSPDDPPVAWLTADCSRGG